MGVGFVGCVFVNWLIENGKFFVLLLEVGGNDMGNYVYDIFGYIDKVVWMYVDWGYYIEL